MTATTTTGTSRERVERALEAVSRTRSLTNAFTSTCADRALADDELLLAAVAAFRDDAEDG